MVNLLPYRNFGGALVASGVLVFSEPKPVAWQTWQGKAWTGRTSVAEKQTIAVTLGAGKNASVETWETTARALLGVPARKAAEKAEDSRWREFWDRSHVFVSSNDPNEPATGPAYQAGRNYQLFRLMRACDAGGELPLKFNGFYNVDAWPNDTDHPLHAEWSSGYDYPGKEASPDFRIWGQLFFGQNQRWLGLPTLADGDADLLAPSTAFYRNRHPIARARAANLHAAGACYVEPLGVEGTCGVVPAADGLCSAVHLTFHFSMGLEHAWMTLLGHSILGTKIDADIPWMVDEIRFFDSFYRAQNKKNTGSELGADGRLVLFPLNGLELISGGINTIETVAGLRRVTAGLLELKELPASDRAFLKKVRQTLPELPTMQRDGKTVFAPAVKWSGEHNSTEFPEMCAVFPYRLAGLLRPETLDMARDTWSLLPSRGDCPQFSPTKLIDRAWQPTIASMAGLGWASEAKRRLVAKITDRLPSYRYPAFFATGDGRPDFNHAASGFVGLQEMLMQCDSKPGGKILLLPAWPSTWDVDFKLHAPQQTTVECVVKRGKVVKLKVTPESRRKDVEIIGPVPEPPLPVSQGKKVMASSTFRLPGYDADKAVDGDLSTRWATDAGQGSGWLEVDLGKPTTVSRAVIQEQSFSQTALFAVESQLADGSWKTLAEGTTIGASKELKFTPTTAQKFRLHIFESKLVPGGGATIDEFQLFEK